MRCSPSGQSIGVPGPLRDESLALLREGYEFLPNRLRRRGIDVCETRLMLQPVTCISGPEAARAFYHDERFTRRGALPPTALTLLQDKGSVALLDGAAHRHRKRLFLDVLSPGRFDALLEMAAAEWRSAAERWQRRSAVVLHAAAREVLCRAACSWAGVPLAEHEAPARATELGAMVHGAGSVGARQVRGQLLRQRSERWLRGVVREIRRGRRAVPKGSVAHAVAWHREPDGALLDTGVAAVELLNVLRPTVAVAHFVTFAALALHEHPEARRRVHEGGPAETEEHVQEVRRLAPFFPLVGGRVTSAFEWRGHRFPDGRWVLLDIYGTNRDPRAWEQPERFRPERFRGWEGDPYALIPQGGGDHATNHRCPGEWAAIALTRGAVAFLTGAIEYRVPDQDLRVRLSQMPALPGSGFVIDRVRLRG